MVAVQQVLMLYSVGLLRNECDFVQLKSRSVSSLFDLHAINWHFLYIIGIYNFVFFKDSLIMLKQKSHCLLLYPIYDRKIPFKRKQYSPFFDHTD